MRLVKLCKGLFPDLIFCNIFFNDSVAREGYT